MDFPAGLRTNLYELTGIPRIFWNFYPSTQSSVDLVDELDRRLLFLEFQLRGQGHHAFADIPNRGVWAFCLSASEQEKLSKSIAFLDVQDSLGGILVTTDLDRLSNAGADTTLEETPSGNLRSANFRSFEKNEVSSTNTSEGDGLDGRLSNIDRQTIYVYLIHSIQRSLALALARNEGWSCYDQYSCLDESTLGLSDFTDPFTTEIISFCCRWQPRGSIEIFVQKRTVPKLHRLSDLLSDKGGYAMLGSRAIALPTQINGTIREIVPFWKSRSADADLRKLKSTTQQILGCFDVDVPFNEDWVELHPTADFADTDQFDQSSERVFLWPANCCYARTPTTVMKALSGYDVDSSTIIDPVQRAQADFLSHCEKKQDSKQTAHQMPTPAQQGETEDALSPLNHRTLLHDASGVYPTPPVGANSQHYQTPIQDEDDSRSHKSTAEAFGQKPDHVPEMLGDQDLDLTEADFEFFDDPGNIDEVLPNPQSPHDIIMKSPSPTNHFPLVEPALEVQSSVQEGTVGADAELLSDISVDNETDLPTTPSTHIMEGPSGRSNHHALLNEASTNNTLDATAGKLSLDDKYASEGPYGFSHDPSAGASTKIGRSEAAAAQVPYIGIADGSASDSDGSAEEELEKNSPFESVGFDDDFSEIASDEADEPTRKAKTSITGKDSVLIEALPISWFYPISPANQDGLSRMDTEAGPLDHDEDPLRFVQMAQMITEHAVHFPSGLAQIEKGPLTCIETNPSQPWLDWFLKNILTILGPLEDLHWKRFDDVVPIMSTSNDDDPQYHQYTRCREPEFCVRRMDTRIDILPAALRLWEDLGLEPQSGTKNLKAIGVPFSCKKYLYEPIQAFLAQMRDIYATCNLGVHELSEDLDLAHDAAFQENADAIGSSLAEISEAGKSIIIYVICSDVSSKRTSDTFDKAETLFDSFRSCLCKHAPQSDITIQIVPESLVFHPTFLATPVLSDLKKLAFEVYDRCVPIETVSLHAYQAAPSLSLARPLPESINFELTPHASRAKLHHDTRIHVAYDWDSEDGWLTASWTDNTGTIAWHASYVIGNEDDDMTEFAKAADEMFETTMVMLDPPDRPARVFVCKYGHYFKSELEVWKSLLVQKSSQHQFTFLIINTSTLLQLANPPAKDTSGEMADQTSTPASTPNAAGSSPDVTTPSGTLGLDVDSDTRLIDLRDETWMCLFDGLVETDTFMASAYALPDFEGQLLKRAGVVNEDGVLSLSVHLMFSNEGTSMALLRESLEMYHKLAFLARMRNITDSTDGILPLHVAAASKGRQAVSSAARRLNSLESD